MIQTMGQSEQKSQTVVVFESQGLTTQQRRGKKNDVGYVKKKRLMIYRFEVGELSPWQKKGNYFPGLSFTLKEALFEPSEEGDPPKFVIDDFQEGTECLLMASDGTSIQYFRIDSVRQRKESGDWYVKVL